MSIECFASAIAAISFICHSDRRELVTLMDEAYDTLNRNFVNFWATHKQHHGCQSACSKVFVSDGFQKPSRFICSNVKMVIHSPELGKLGIVKRYSQLSPNILIKESYRLDVAIARIIMKSEN